MEKTPPSSNISSKEEVKQVMINRDEKQGCSSSIGYNNAGADVPDHNKSVIPPVISDATSSPSSSRRSPDPCCAICLEPLQNKSYTNSCLHMFCFKCLVEWSKIKPVCPLCKQEFKTIIHNVQEDLQYDTYHINNHQSSADRIRNFIPPNAHISTSIRINTSSNVPRFRFRTTLTADRIIERSTSAANNDSLQLQIENHRRRFAPHSVRFVSTTQTTNRVPSLFRSRVYRQNLWVTPQQSNRFRIVSPDFFKRNPACTHRLIAWLNRELVVLLHNIESQIVEVLELIMALITRYEITSPEFYTHIEPYLHHRTSHFVHEFYNFATSPHDMDLYDVYATYSEEVIDVEDSNSDVIILDNDEQPSNESSEVTNASHKKKRKSKSSMNKQKPVDKVVLKRNLETDSWVTVMGPLPFMHDFSMPSYSHPGPSRSGASSSSVETVERPMTLISPVRQESSDDEIEIINELKPKSLRTPEIIELSSDEESHKITKVSSKKNDYLSSSYNSPVSPPYNPLEARYSPTSPSYSPVSPSYSPVSPSYSPVSPSYSPASYSPVSPTYSSNILASSPYKPIGHISPSSEESHIELSSDEESQKAKITSKKNDCFRSSYYSPESPPYNSLGAGYRPTSPSYSPGSPPYSPGSTSYSSNIPANSSYKPLGKKSKESLSKSILAEIGSDSDSSDCIYESTYKRTPENDKIANENESKGNSQSYEEINLVSPSDRNNTNSQSCPNSPLNLVVSKNSRKVNNSKIRNSEINEGECVSPLTISVSNKESLKVEENNKSNGNNQNNDIGLNIGSCNPAHTASSRTSKSSCSLPYGLESPLNLVISGSSDCVNRPKIKNLVETEAISNEGISDFNHNNSEVNKNSFKADKIKSDGKFDGSAFLGGSTLNLNVKPLDTSRQACSSNASPFNSTNQKNIDSNCDRSDESLDQCQTSVKKISTFDLTEKKVKKEKRSASKHSHKISTDSTSKKIPHGTTKSAQIKKECCKDQTVPEHSSVISVKTENTPMDSATTKAHFSKRKKELSDIHHRTLSPDIEPVCKKIRKMCLQDIIQRTRRDQFHDLTLSEGSSTSTVKTEKNYIPSKIVVPKTSRLYGAPSTSHKRKNSFNEKLVIDGSDSESNSRPKKKLKSVIASNIVNLVTFDKDAINSPKAHKNHKVEKRKKRRIVKIPDSSDTDSSCELVT